MSDGGTSPFLQPPGGRGSEARSQADPVSWLQIEQGWTVEGSDGNAIGRVAQVVGVKEDDIFDGLAVDTGAGTPVYVPGEQVGLIYPSRVTLKLPAESVNGLAPFADTPRQTTIRPGPEPLAQRLQRWLRR